MRLFSSNDYLGMSTHSAVRIAAARAALAHGSGPRSSALVCGYTPEHSKLERALASLKGTEECILFSSGYAANCGVIPALCDDATCEIFSDALNHASIVDGCALAKRKGTRVTLYPHGDTSALSRLVRESRAKRIMVITDSLFSMDGDFAPLIEITSMKREENARCGRARVMVMVDEAHATLVCGDGGNGGGAASMFGVSDEIDVSIGTMSKAIGSHGGFVACSGVDEAGARELGEERDIQHVVAGARHRRGVGGVAFGPKCRTRSANEVVRADRRVRRRVRGANQGATRGNHVWAHDRRCGERVAGGVCD